MQCFLRGFRFRHVERGADECDGVPVIVVTIEDRESFRHDPPARAVGHFEAILDLVRLRVVRVGRQLHSISHRRSIAGNQPFESEIAPLLIVTNLEQYNYAGATAIAVVMLLISMLVLFLINFIQNRERVRRGL